MKIWIINKLESLVEYLKQDETSYQSEEKGVYSSLAPKVLTEKKDLERVKPYLDALKNSFESKEIFNIALTGGYGSGKSTIIKTFQSKNGQYKYLNLSLASFKDNTPDEDKLERKLEISILQQIFYHVKPSQIPDSRFKRIVNTTNRKLWSISIFFISWLFSAITLFKFGYINKLNPKTWDIQKALDLYFILLLLLFSIGIGFFSKAIVRLFSNSKINKLNIKGELELGEQIDKSVFNQHLEEILYFFERTEFNVVVIEDLDRFNSTEIFTKLRELNILINKSTVINRKVKFLYAVRDEMFTDKTERVKFFDFIVPVIPFINPSNASDQLTKLIEDAKLTNILSKEFYEDVVTFIDDIDMRLLINIFHEYYLYRENLSKELNQDELFSIIIYKNIFPDDFGELSKKKGKLFKILTGKPIYVEDLIAQIDTEIDNLKNQIRTIERERILYVRELRSIYLNAIIAKLPNLSSFSKNEVELSISDALVDDNFEFIYTQPKITYNYFTSTHGNYYISHKNREARFSFSDVEKEVNSDLTYKQREALIIDKSHVESLKGEIQKLERNKIEIESWTLQQIFQEHNIEQYLTEFPDMPLVKNLLFNGYINESYTDYISLFHEISITKEDFDFEKKLKSGSILAFDYKLTKIENLIKKINSKYFSRDGILNFDLVDFLLKSKSSYASQLNSVFRVLTNERDNSNSFIISYLDRNKSLELFIPEICSRWENFWKFINSQQFTKEKIDGLLLLILLHARIEDIAKFQQDEHNIAVYIEEYEDILGLVTEKIGYDRFTSLCERLVLKFKSLQFPSASQKELFVFIYEHNHYVLNKGNILLIIDHICGQNNQDNFENKLYTTVLESGCSHLISYVEQEIEYFVQHVLLLADSMREPESSIISLLNNYKLSKTSKNAIILKQDVLITDINQITDDEVWGILIKNNKIKPTWVNVHSYFEQLPNKTFDENIVSFLNVERNYSELAESSLMNLGINEENRDELINNLIYCKELSFASYESLQESIPFTYDILEYSKINVDRCMYMIKSGFLNPTLENFQAVKSTYNNLHIILVERYIARYLEIWDDIELNETDIIKLIESSSLSIDLKAKVIEKIDENIIIKDVKLAALIAEILLVRHITLSFEVLQVCFKALTNNDKKLELINQYSNDIGNSQIQVLVVDLGEEYRNLFEKQHKPVFLDNEMHRKLFDNLMKRDLILRYESHEKHADKIRVFAKY